MSSILQLRIKELLFQITRACEEIQNLNATLAPEVNKTDLKYERFTPAREAEVCLEGALVTVRDARNKLLQEVVSLKSK